MTKIKKVILSIVLSLGLVIGLFSFAHSFNEQNISYAATSNYVTFSCKAGDKLVGGIAGDDGYIFPSNTTKLYVYNSEEGFTLPRVERAGSTIGYFYVNSTTSVYDWGEIGTMYTFGSTVAAGVEGDVTLKVPEDSYQIGFTCNVGDTISGGIAGDGYYFNTNSPKWYNYSPTEDFELPTITRTGYTIEYFKIDFVTSPSDCNWGATGDKYETGAQIYANTKYGAILFTPVVRTYEVTIKNIRKGTTIVGYGTIDEDQEWNHTYCTEDNKTYYNPSDIYEWNERYPGRFSLLTLSRDDCNILGYRVTAVDEDSNWGDVGTVYSLGEVIMEHSRYGNVTMEPMYRYLLSYNNIKAGCLFNGEYCSSATSFSIGYKNGQTFRLAQVEKPNCENLWFEVYSSDPESNWGANGTRYEIGQEMPDNMVGTVQLNLKWEWDSYDVVLDPSGYSFTAEAIAQLQAVVPCGYVNNMGQFVIQYRLFNDGVDKNLNYNTASFNELGFTEVPIVSLVGGTSNGWQGVSKLGSQMANCNGVDVDSVNRKIIVHAKVSPGKYYVQFNLNDGATPEESRIFTTSSISFGYGNKIYVLYHDKAWGDDLTRRGYVFLGWKAPETYGVNPNLDSSIARYGDSFGAENRQITGETLLPDGEVYVKNLTGVAGGTVIFFAQWEEVEHTVTYDYSYNGGQSASKTTDSVKVDEPLDLSVTASKIDNNGVAWDFVGWNTDRYATWVYSDGELIMDEEDVTLYAIYKKYVMVNFWNISEGGRYINHTFYNNEQYCYLTCPTVKTISGWQIVGWGSTPTATSRSCNSGGSYYTTTWDAGRTYYAVYSYDVTVSYLPNGASGSTEASVGTAYATAINGNGTYNTTKATVSLKTNGFTPKEGFSFQGWSEISEATSGLVEGTTLTLDENKTYYATWRKGLQVSFYQIGETDPTILVKYIYNQDTSTDWVTTVPDVETYGDYETVVGWTKNPASSAIDLVAGTRSVLTNGTSYYAVCSKPVVLSYDAGGKVIANELPDDETKNIYAVASTQTTPNYIKTSFKVTDIIPLTSGSIFHGWNDRADLQGNTYYKNDTIENVDADLVLYATWGNASLRLEISDIVTPYSEQLQQFTFDGATEGTGDYTYSLFSQKDATTEQDVSWFAVNSTTLIVASTTPSGEYRVVVKVKDNVSSLEATSGFKVTINYLAINVPTANTGLVYSGREQIGVSEGAGYTLVDNKAINSGNYIAKVTPGNNYRWIDGTRETKEVAWMIDYVQVAIPTAVSGLIYSGGEQVGVVELAGYTVTDNKATNAGNYVAKATVKENYKWTDGTREVKDIDWMIDYATINVPTAVSGLIYSGREQIGVVAGAGYTLTNNTGVDAGAYAATAIILENYKWVGGTRLNKTINWSIEQKDLSIIWPSMTEYSYDGRAHKVEANLNGVYSGDIITINYKNEIDKINVGEYTTTIVSLNGERAGNYQLPTDNLSCSWEIKKCVVYTIWKTTEFTFDGNAHNPTYELFGNIATEMLILKLSSKDFINAGTYNVTASIDSVIGGQESASNYDLTNTSVEVKINKANIVVAQEPRVFDLTYTGFNQYLISEGSTFHGTFMYSADGETWQTSVPVAKDANQYVVYYKVLGDKNHNDIQAVQLTARINKRDITVEWSDELSFTYNGEEHIPQATAKWQDYELSLDVTAANSVDPGAHIARAQLKNEADKANFNLLNTAIEFDIKAKPFSILDLITNPLFIAGVAAILVGAGITITVIAVKSAKKNKKRMIADYKIDGSAFTRDDKNNFDKH